MTGEWPDDDLDEFELDLADPAAHADIEPSSRVGRFARNTASGAILNAVALGLAEVFDPALKEEAPIVQDADGEPFGRRHVDAVLDPDDPSASRVTVRPWLAKRHP
jgi:hypothetical protein